MGWQHFRSYVPVVLVPRSQRHRAGICAIDQPRSPWEGDDERGSSVAARSRPSPWPFIPSRAGVCSALWANSCFFFFCFFRRSVLLFFSRRSPVTSTLLLQYSSRPGPTGPVTGGNITLAVRQTGRVVRSPLATVAAVAAAVVVFQKPTTVFRHTVNNINSESFDLLLVFLPLLITVVTGLTRHVSFFFSSLPEYIVKSTRTTFFSVPVEARAFRERRVKYKYCRRPARYTLIRKRGRAEHFFFIC